MAAEIKLESRLDVGAALALHAHLSDAGGPVALDASAVEMCGAAAAQVLVAFSKNHSLALDKVSDAMRADLAVLGLDSFFNGGLHV